MSGMSLTELRDAAEDRDLWRKLTMAIAKTLQADNIRWQSEKIFPRMIPSNL